MEKIKPGRYNTGMQKAVSPSPIPARLKPYFQEYDVAQLDIVRDANLVIQRVLEFGNWDEIRWLFSTYRSKRIRLFLREHGERWLNPVTFNYWRKLLGVRRWKKSPFPNTELWNH
ncbi:hypothetical protein FBQ99_03455 [Chloroflexi bacterium CFX2]|nr:hypothetical protein [Chloroflexi bacterium CFX2]